ncbi:MAG: hormogonium polysaccharide biosynthesis protein HpsA [Cyanobacteria bacterium P01_D01_bin.14]
MNRSKLSLWQRCRRIPNRLAGWLLRFWFWANRSARTGQAGFVLPTTVLLLLMVSLTVGALSYRSFTRVNQTIAYRSQQTVDSFAEPAIDRAKAKIEYLFTQEEAISNKRPPSSDDLQNTILANAGAGSNLDPYTLADETQLDINSDSSVDAAWSFDNQGTTVVYSIVIPHENGSVTLSDNDASAKANALVTRNGPINTLETKDGCPVSRLSGEGWQDAGSDLQKNIQVDILAITGSGGPNRTVSAAEYQQVRSAPKGNKYGAWFRYDMEIFPGQPFRWNGAMHSESNIMVSNNFKGYAVSAPSSCIYDEDASEITITGSTEDANSDGSPDGFQGQYVAGESKQDRYGASSSLLHIVNGLNVPYNADIDEDEDSVNEDDSSQDFMDVAVDPVAIFTRDETENFDQSTWNPIDPIGDDRDWTGNTDLRVKNLSDAERPFLDDGYRADNRYGPKPVYNDSNSLKVAQGVTLGTPNKIGDVINNNTALTTDDAATGNYGLDGYWERRAAGSGLRVIVGQRLELGNAYGWTSGEDPLYPPENPATLTPTVDGIESDGSIESNSNDTYKGPAENRQMRSLRDNLAAVQGMVAYHYTQGNDTPYICMAATTHPGTQETLINSRTFSKYAETTGWQIDFLNGVGTNGWEFDFTYAASDYAAGQALGDALRNLAYFAGDPAGGAPSFPPVQGVVGTSTDFVHPYPYMAMWGDHSLLRRIFGTGTSYADLSLADKSTLHTAACTMGMLAYNLDSLKAEYDQLVQDDALLNSMGSALIALSVADGNQARTWIEALEGASFADMDKARVLALYRQVVRDRAAGFNIGNTAASADICTTADFPGTGTTTAANQDALVDAFCSSAQLPAYPSLFYLFPTADHDQLGNGAEVQPVVTEEYLSEGGAASNYIATFTGTTLTGGVNSAADLYTAVDPSTIALTPAAAITNFKQPYAAGADISGADRAALTGNNILAAGTAYELTFLDKAMMDGRELLSVRVLDLDIEKLTTIDTGDSKTFFDDGGTNVAWIPEADAIFYAFREDAVREDEIVRPRLVSDAATAWAECEVFDNLKGVANCIMDVVPTQSNQVGTSDPPLNDENLISPKPVDMFADPDRRPYGFRLFNGEDFNRPLGASAVTSSSGLTFVTDNPAYVMGDFNLHQDTLGAILEEYTTPDLLGTAFASEPTEATAKTMFYDRAAANLDDKFADPEFDQWRPAEIFADAITILSGNFRDGWIEDAYLLGTDGTAGASTLSSYLNWNRLNINDANSVGFVANPNRWQREDQKANEADTDDTLPILFDRNGIVYKSNESGSGPYSAFPRNSGRQYISFFDPSDLDGDRTSNEITAAETRVNALLIAGIVPMQAAQSYGGLHNFPRLLEYWTNQNLIISGGFFQLNFSTHATAPYDQDAWEPSTSSTPNAGNEFIYYYKPPTRVWGYDVAFQYNPAAPIASRFTTSGRPRSEFYRQLSADDPYIEQLCTALQGQDGTVTCN